MRKILKRFVFMLSFFWLGTAYGLAASGEEVTANVQPAPRAIQCSAAFELMNRAAPEWSQQADVVKARLDWAQYVNSMAGEAGANAHEQVSNEMSFLANAIIDEPTALSRLAVQCVADAPNMTVSG